jgi:hypothetical protein
VPVVPQLLVASMTIDGIQALCIHKFMPLLHFKTLNVRTTCLIRGTPYLEDTVWSRDYPRDVRPTSAVHLQNGASVPHGAPPRWSPFWQVQPLVSRRPTPKSAGPGPVHRYPSVMSLRTSLSTLVSSVGTVNVNGS